MNLERLLQQHQQLDTKAARILELNPDHELINALAKTAKEQNSGNKIKDAALLLLDQAHVMEGEPVIDPVAFARRMEAFMKKGL